MASGVAALTPAESDVSPLLRLLRPHQYAKNLLVFAAPGAASRLDEAAVVAQATLAFVLFCAVSSAGYIVNDLVDAEADRLHPTKRLRPIASGQVSPARARLLLVALSGPALVLGALLGGPFAATLLAYGATTVTYSLWLKRIPWIELLVVSAGFVLRAIGGGTATGTRLSPWFLLVVSAGALLMITGKRLGELLALGPATASRRVLTRYRPQALRVVAFAAAVVAVGGYTAWAAAEAGDRASDSTGSTLLRLTAVPFALAIGRYLLLAWRGAGEAPESLITHDRIMVATGLGWVLMYSAGLYL